MQVRWSPAAAEDLTRIAEYTRKENPSAAQRVARTIYEGAGTLENFPNRGKVGRGGKALQAKLDTYVSDGWEITKGSFNEQVE